MAMSLSQYKKILTKTELAAIEYIGLHRKTEVLVGKHLSKRIYNQLNKKGYIMDSYKSKKMKYQRVQLTARGEVVFTAMHPYSKYRIK
jgi:hypothetical protein